MNESFNLREDGKKVEYSADYRRIKIFSEQGEYAEFEFDPHEGKYTLRGGTLNLSINKYDKIREWEKDLRENGGRYI